MHRKIGASDDAATKRYCAARLSKREMRLSVRAVHLSTAEMHLGGPKMVLFVRAHAEKAADAVKEEHVGAAWSILSRRRAE